LARQAGVEVLTMGSDSHRPTTVGRNLAEAIVLARETGFTHYHTFTARKPVPHFVGATHASP
ncbi:MAG TPA: hypothetical protein VHS06_05375, partial [Chloroflexota bacterium]|nr:hypothetical protein [Chloroflexota bacterium]